ncbi:MAG: hypothetical protein GXZ11_05575 [Tissierellia bacterium]|nr:hypothetical protein [Tissierellia bacterium]
MAIYRWKKYTVNTVRETRYRIKFSEYTGQSSHPESSGYSGYTVSSDGKISLTGEYIAGSTERTRYYDVSSDGKTVQSCAYRQVYDSSPGGYFWWWGTAQGRVESYYINKDTKGVYLDTVVAEENTYPLDGKAGEYWYVRDGLANTGPIISGANLDLGGKNTDFQVEYMVTDAEGDSVKVEILMDDLQIQAPTPISLGVQNALQVQIKNYGMGSHTLTIKAHDGKTSTERKYFWEKVNNAPTISGSDGDLGSKNSAFTVIFQVDDEDPSDVITAAVRLNRVEIKRFENAPKNETLSFTISDERIQALELNETNTVEIAVSDTKGGTNYRRYTFRRTNAPPIISGSDKDFGTLTTPPTVTYSVTDTEADDVTVQLILDGAVIKTTEQFTQNQSNTWKLTSNEWIKTKPGLHTLKIVATDSLGGRSTRTYTFTRHVPRLEVIVRVADTDAAAKKINVQPVWKKPVGCNVRVFACNNGNDTAPTWEDITEVVLAERAANLANSVKTAEKWGVGVKVIMEKGTATSECQLTGIGGSFS